jgi:FAD:protein FMN transferase
MKPMGLLSRSVQTIPFHHHPVLGTDATGSIVSRSRRPERLERMLLTGIDNLENVFSVYRADSEFSRWRRGEIAAVSAPLLDLLERTEHWVSISEGAFNPSVGVVSDIWRAAADSQVLPTDNALHEAAQQVAGLPFRLGPKTGDVTHLADCTALNLNAIAKGYIVEVVCDAMLHLPDVESVVLNIGGDLIHRGKGSTVVAIQNPLHAYDNEPPLFTLSISQAAVATSGSASRGWQIADVWYSHVIDPRTARPVRHIASASVVAQSAADADAIATVLSVVDDIERPAFTSKLDDAVAYCVVRADGSTDTNEQWNNLCT